MTLFKTLAVVLVFAALSFAGTLGSPAVTFSYEYTAKVGCSCTPVTVTANSSSSQTSLFQVQVLYYLTNAQGAVASTGAVTAFGNHMNGYPTKIELLLPAGARVQFVMVTGFASVDAKISGGDAWELSPGVNY